MISPKDIFAADEMSIQFDMMGSRTIGDRKDRVCLQLHGQVSRQPKRCRSAMFDPKGRAFFSGSLLNLYVLGFEN